jgi:hypothetical protein
MAISAPSAPGGSRQPLPVQNIPKEGHDATTNFSVFSAPRQRTVDDQADRQHQQAGRRRSQARIADQPAAGADGDDDEDHLDPFQQHRLEGRRCRQEIGPPVGRLLFQEIGPRAKAFSSSWMAMKPAARRSPSEPAHPEEDEQHPDGELQEMKRDQAEQRPEYQDQGAQHGQPSAIPVRPAASCATPPRRARW